MFACYVEILLAMPTSPGRDRLLKRAFTLVETMLASDDRDVHDLAGIGMLEGRELWFFSRALAFIGPIARKELDEFQPYWKEAANLNAGPDLEKEIIDLYGAREVGFLELQSEGICWRMIPGITTEKIRQRFATLAIAKNNPDVAVGLSSFGKKSCLNMVCPTNLVACTEESLQQLSQDLANVVDRKSAAEVEDLQIPIGERVWGMGRGKREHLRYEGELWIADDLISKHLTKAIIEVISGIRAGLQSFPP